MQLQESAVLECQLNVGPKLGSLLSLLMFRSLYHIYSPYMSISAVFFRLLFLLLVPRRYFLLGSDNSQYLEQATAKAKRRMPKTPIGSVQMASSSSTIVSVYERHNRNDFVDKLSLRRQ